MDVDAVEAAGRELQAKAQSLDAIIANLDKTVASLNGVWDGKDAQTFVNEWWPQHRKELTAASASVAGLGQSALNNASEQRQASGVSTAGVAGIATVVAVAATDSSSGTSADTAGSNFGTLPPGGGKDAYEAFAAKTSHMVGGDGPYDGNGAAVDNCTAWAAFRRHELGLSVASPPGNGYQMAGNVGGTPSTAPSLGALVSYGGPKDNGHVMVVEQVMGPKEFRVSEMNYGGLGKMATTTVWTQEDNGSWKSSDGRVEQSLTIAK
jgi:surface antigen